MTSQTVGRGDRKSTRLNSSHANISYAVFCLKKKEEAPAIPGIAIRQRFHIPERGGSQVRRARVRVVVNEIDLSVRFGFGGARLARYIDPFAVVPDAAIEILQLAEQISQPVRDARKCDFVSVPARQPQYILFPYTTLFR